MRSIKFRAYDKLEKRMCKVMSLHWQDDKLVAVKVDGEAEPLPIDGRFVIEQYTGLSDKNGVEIAVGDILKVVSKLADNPKLFFVEMCYKEWNGDVFDLVCYDSNNDNSPIHHVRSFDGIVENGEVIGNIHENPELMEEKT